MTVVQEDIEPGRVHGSSGTELDLEDSGGAGDPPYRALASAETAAISPVRKAAIVLVSLDQSLASQL